MLLIPKSEFVSIINNLPHKLIDEDDIKCIFEKYGDTYYYDGDASKIVCVTKNPARIKKMQELSNTSESEE